MTEIKDLAGLSQPLTKLIEVVAIGIGKVAASFLNKRDSDARAYEVKVIGDAIKELAGNEKMQVLYKDGKFDISNITTETDSKIESLTLEQRAAERLGFQETKRQDCIESIVKIAAAELSNEPVVADEKPLDEWITRYFSLAQEISTAHLQDLWGRLLAGEIKQPGRYSLRTLEFIRNISSRDAALFQKVGALAIKHSKEHFVPRFDDEWLTQYGYPPVDFIDLAELGLLYPSTLKMTFSESDLECEFSFLNGEYIVNVPDPGNLERYNFTCWRFTRTGGELLSLIQNSYFEEYLTLIAMYFAREGQKVIIGRVIETKSDGSHGIEIIKKVGKWEDNLM